jgi:hypothetical protein
MVDTPTKSAIAEVNELCCAIGHVVVQWGFVEHNLTLCLANIYSNYGGDAITEKQKIEKFQRKQIKYLQECFDNLDSLMHFRDEGVLLLKRVSILLDERDKIIHSTYNGLYKGSFNFIRFNFTPQMIYISKVKRTITSILKTRKKIEDLAADIGRFALRLAGK